MKKNLSLIENQQHANIYVYENGNPNPIKTDVIHFVDVHTLLQMARFMSEHLPCKDSFIEVEYWNGICTVGKHFRRGLMLEA